MSDKYWNPEQEYKKAKTESLNVPLLTTKEDVEAYARKEAFTKMKAEVEDLPKPGSEHPYDSDGEPVDDREAAMYAEYFDAEVISTLRARQAVMDAAEKRVADLIFNSTTWTGAPLTSVITNEWDDFTNATPIVDVAAAVKLVWAGSGLWPNALIINRRVFKNLKQCDDIIAAIASSGAGFAARQADITEAQLAAVFDLDMIIVAGTPKNTADAGQAATIAPIWSDEYAMVAKVSVSQDIREPCLGRMFHWGGDGSSVGGTVESYRDETVRADIIRYRHDVDEKVLLTEAGHLLSNVTT